MHRIICHEETAHFSFVFKFLLIFFILLYLNRFFYLVLMTGVFLI